MGTLYTVATPIGNLEDITYRAIDTLKRVDIIACEDTRVTKRLLQHYSIETKTIAYHQHSDSKTEQKLLDMLAADQDVALVSDAGTPTISDPGSALIRAAWEADAQVVPIPGPSAMMAALQAAGVNTHRVLFVGFIPHKKGRQTLFEMISSTDHTVVAYESPHRIMKTLESLKDCGRQIVVARELTKIHEEFVRGDAEAVFQEFSQRETIKGEFVFIVHS